MSSVVHCDFFDPPPEAVIFAIASPAFAIPAPELRHAERIAPQAMLRMREAWTAGEFPAGEIRFTLIRDATVAREGLVFDAAGRLLRASVTEHSEVEIARARASVRIASGVAGPVPLPGTCVLCKKRGVGNYGHWMMEMLPRAYLARRHLAPADLRYLVGATPQPMRSVMQQSLSMLEFRAADVIATGDDPVRVESLVVIDGLTRHGAYMSPKVLDGIDALASGIEAEGQERLFVTRALRQSRRLVDELAIEAFARAAGYAVLDPGTLPLREQIARFKAARHVVGVSGAGLTNVTFSPPGTRVVNLAPATMSDTFYWFICGLRGHRYLEIRCAQSGREYGPAAWDTAITLDPELLGEVFR